MSGRAREGAPLAQLIRLAIGPCQQAEREHPRRGPGRPPIVPDWVMATLIMIAVLKRRKSKSSQYRFLQQAWPQLQEYFPGVALPARSTYFRRFRRAYALFRAAIVVQGRRLIAQGIVDAEAVAVDKTLLRALGPAWPKKEREQNRLPRGVDRDSRWGYSEHDGWVQGYSSEVVVSAGKNGVVAPLLASVATANVKEQTSFPDKIADLPRETKSVLADRGYDSNALAETIEWTPQGERTGRRFLCRQQSRRRAAQRQWRETAARRQHRERRQERAAYLKTDRAQRLFARRGKTVEPFFSWFKSCFDLHDHVHHRALDNNRTHIAAAIFGYQLLLHYNHNHGHDNGEIQWILDSL